MALVEDEAQINGEEDEDDEDVRAAGCHLGVSAPSLTVVKTAENLTIHHSTKTPASPTALTDITITNSSVGCRALYLTGKRTF